MIGEDLDNDRIDKICFALKDFLKTLSLTHEEELVLIWDMMYHAIIDYHSDDDKDHVDVEKAHVELDRLVQDIRETIDSANDKLFIKE
jgi:hypothetical protein